MTISRPVNLQKPFADTGAKTTIPIASQIAIAPGRASFEDGFPPLNRTPIAAGGIPPFGTDMNGILNIMSQHTAFLGAGGRYQFDAALAASIGGYPVGFVLQDNAGLIEYVNILAGNTTDFNTTPSAIGVSWMPYAGKMESSLTANGYQKFPNGLILQWGGLVIPTGNGDTVTFPIPFSSAVFAIVAVDYGEAAQSTGAAIDTLSSFLAYGKAVSTGAYSSTSYRWFAVGT